MGYVDEPSDKVESIEGVIGSKPSVPMSKAIARKAVRLRGELKAEGRDVVLRDTRVGATAVVFDEPVLPRNVADFDRIPGVEVETY